MPLNSADVAEVIQRRLLKKTGPASASCPSFIIAKSNNLKTLFDFSDGSIGWKTSATAIISFTAIPLFLTSIRCSSWRSKTCPSTMLSKGKHSSVGKVYAGRLPGGRDPARESSVGGLATFDQMFEGIRTALKSNVQQSILIAENNLGDEFATRIPERRSFWSNTSKASSPQPATSRS